MSDLESAEAFARSIIQAVEDDHLLSREALPLWIAAEIQERDAAVALAAKREAIEELRRAYWDNRDTSWETEAQRLLEKYGPTSEAPTNGNG